MIAKSMGLALVLSLFLVQSVNALCVCIYPITTCWWTPVETVNDQIVYASFTKCENPAPGNCFILPSGEPESCTVSMNTAQVKTYVFGGSLNSSYFNLSANYENQMSTMSECEKRAFCPDDGFAWTKNHFLTKRRLKISANNINVDTMCIADEQSSTLRTFLSNFCSTNPNPSPGNE